MSKVNFKILGLLLIITLIIWGCSSDDDSPTEPTPPNEILVDSSTIDPSGGEFVTDNFTLTVPSGAIDSTISLSLYTNSAVNPFGSDAVSPTYRLAGFPDQFSDTLRLRIKYNGTLTDSSFIALCEEVHVKSLGRMDTIFHLFDAHDSSGYLICNIPPTTTSKSVFKPGSPGGINEPSASLSMIWSAITGYLKHLTAGGHFNIAYPFKTITSANVLNLDSCLEEAYTDIQTVGFSYNARTSWPMEVTIKNLDVSVLGYAASSPLGTNYDVIALNTFWVTNYTTIRTTCGHEWFHTVQAMYDTTRSAMSKSKGWFYPHYWLDEATAVWSEDMFTANPNYVPIALTGLEDEPFKGVHAGITGGRDADHGYGMAPLIKDLFTRKGAAGNAFIHSIYQNIRIGKDPIRALIDAYGSEPITWLANFYAAYMQGTYYSVAADNFITADGDTIDVGQPDFVEASIIMPYPDLSASIFVIDPDKPDFDLADSLKLKATASGRHPDIIVFRKTGGTWTLLYNQQDSVTVGDLPAMALGGSVFVVLVVNDEYMGPDYNTNTDIEFTVELIDQLDLSVYNKFSLGYKVLGRGINYLADTFFVSYNDGFGGNGSFTGNTFVAVWDTTYKGYSDTTHTWGSFIAVYDQANNRISGFNLLDTTRQYSSASDTYEITEIIGSGLPFKYIYEGDMYFSSDGAITCSHISTFHYNAYYPPPASWWTRAISYECNDTSYLRINFYDD